MSAIAAWFAKEGAGLLLGFLGKFLLDMMAERRADQAQRDLGRVEAQRDQAENTIAAQQAELDALANAPQDNDEAARRLEAGSA